MATPTDGTQADPARAWRPLVPGWPQPAYRYVPGQGPHPERSPDGHQHLSRLLAAGVGLEAGPLDGRPLYRHGVDLFAGEFYWEAHEVWEHLWRAAPVGSSARELLQALIQWAAGRLQRRMGRLAGAGRLEAKARSRMVRVRAAEGVIWAGLDLDLALAQVIAQPPSTGPLPWVGEHAAI